MKFVCRQHKWSHWLAVPWRACLREPPQITEAPAQFLWKSSENWNLFRVSPFGYNCLTPYQQKIMQPLSQYLSNTKVPQLVAYQSCQKPWQKSMYITSTADRFSCCFGTKSKYCKSLRQLLTGRKPCCLFVRRMFSSRNVMALLLTMLYIVLLT